MRGASEMQSSSRVVRFFKKLITRVFVDSVWIHQLWGCHRLPERSFFIGGRQFHVCARCTGLIVGIPSSVLLIPLSSWSLPIFACSSTLLISDGMTQWCGWRSSNNTLRFWTGFLTAASFLPTLFAVVVFLWQK